MEGASVMMVGLNPERIMQGLLVLESQKRGIERTLRPVCDYTKFIMKCAESHFAN